MPKSTPDSTLSRDLILASLIVLATSCIAYLLKQSNYVNSWFVAFITLFLNWQVVFLAVGDQIIRNYRSGRASQQLSWTVFLANIAENFAWVMLGWGVNDPVIVVARVPGLFFDQIVFWQMLWSTEEAEKRGKAFVWLKYAMTPFVVAVAAVTIAPLWFLPRLQAGYIPQALKYFVSSVWLWSAAGWVLQLQKNKKSDVLTGRDFSFKIPLLVQFFLASWLVNEYFNGRTGLVMYLINGIALVINTALLIQSFMYVRLWRKISPPVLQALQLLSHGATAKVVSDNSCQILQNDGAEQSFALTNSVDIRALIAAGAQDAR